MQEKVIPIGAMPRNIPVEMIGHFCRNIYGSAIPSDESIAAATRIIPARSWNIHPIDVLVASDYSLFVTY